MYNKQLRFQKLVCLLAIIAAAVYFVYALGMITDIHDALKSTMRNPNDLTQTKVPGSIIYYDMQDFNKQFVNISIVLILAAAFLFVMNTHTRRKYYIGNYLAVGIYSVATLGVTFWAHTQIDAYARQYMTTVDFAALQEYADMWGTLYLDNTNLLDLHYYVCALALIAVVLLVGNTVWKVQLMKAESKLIEEGKEAAV